MACVKVTLTVESSSSSGLSCCLVFYSTMYHSSFAHLNCFQRFFSVAVPHSASGNSFARHLREGGSPCPGPSPGNRCCHSSLDTCQPSRGTWAGQGVLVGPSSGRRQAPCPVPQEGAFLVILRCSQLWETFHRFSPGWVSASSSEAEIFFFCSLPPVAMGALKTIEFSVLPPGA